MSALGTDGAGTKAITLSGTASPGGSGRSSGAASAGCGGVCPGGSGAGFSGSGAGVSGSGAGGSCLLQPPNSFIISSSEYSGVWGALPEAEALFSCSAS
jgi:hypothetical protein